NGLSVTLGPGKRPMPEPQPPCLPRMRPIEPILLATRIKVARESGATGATSLPLRRTEVAIDRTMAIGNRAVVEWWTQMDVDGTPVALPGALLLDLDDDGLCRALREYWNLQLGTRVPPPDGWGT